MQYFPHGEYFVILFLKQYNIQTTFGKTALAKFFNLFCQSLPLAEYKNTKLVRTK